MVYHCFVELLLPSPASLLKLPTISYPTRAHEITVNYHAFDAAFMRSSVVNYFAFMANTGLPFPVHLNAVLNFPNI